MEKEGVTRRPTVAGLGEILWDVFPDRRRLGGATSNFAWHVASLGGAAHMVSAVGADEPGDLAVEALDRQGVCVDRIARLEKYPTGSVHVHFDDDAQPRYVFGEDEAWDHIAWTHDLETLAMRADAACFGTLAQRSPVSRQTIQRFVATMKKESLRVFDVNLRPPFYDYESIEQSLRLADVFKLNDEELEIISPRLKLSGSVEDRLGQLADRYDLRLVALSRGKDGAMLAQGDAVSDFSGEKVEVKDAVGAGDAFTATLTLGLLAGEELDALNRRACRIAAFVCTQSGATPTLPNELIDQSA